MGSTGPIGPPRPRFVGIPDDFKWFQQQWGAHMLEEHGDSWGTVFAGWVQHILDEHENGIPNAFSVFVNTETRRCFPTEVALRVPWA